MKRFKGTAFLAAILLSFFTIAAPTARAEGGKAGNGGLGVTCGNGPTEVYDAVEAKDRSIRIAAPVEANRDRFFENVLARLASFPVLRDTLAARLKAHGRWKLWERTDSGRTFDEFTDLSLAADCRLTQLAVFDLESKRPRLAPDGLSLSETQGIYLELHEAIYAVGYLDYEHSNPILTRELFAELAREKTDRAKLESVVFRFTHYAALRRDFIRDHPLGKWVGIYTTDRILLNKNIPPEARASVKVEAAAAQLADLVVEYDGAMGLVFYADSVDREGKRTQIVSFAVNSSLQESRASVTDVLLARDGTTLWVRKRAKNGSPVRERFYLAYLPDGSIMTRVDASEDDALPTEAELKETKVFYRLRPFKTTLTPREAIALLLN